MLSPQPACHLKLLELNMHTSVQSHGFPTPPSELHSGHAQLCNMMYKKATAAQFPSLPGNARRVRRILPELQHTHGWPCSLYLVFTAAQMQAHCLALGCTTQPPGTPWVGWCDGYILHCLRNIQSPACYQQQRCCLQTCRYSYRSSIQQPVRVNHGPSVEGALDN
jgi:hypothetical protein